MLQTRLEKLARDKHSSLLRKFVNYGRKRLITLVPGRAYRALSSPAAFHPSSPSDPDPGTPDPPPIAPPLPRSPPREPRPPHPPRSAGQDAPAAAGAARASQPARRVLHRDPLHPELRGRLQAALAQPHWVRVLWSNPTGISLSLFLSFSLSLFLSFSLSLFLSFSLSLFLSSLKLKLVQMRI